MKFAHGAWLLADGVTAHFAKRIQEFAVQPGKSLSFSTVDRTGTKGVDSFEGKVMQVRVSSPMADVIRVQVRHHASKRSGVNGFDLDYESSAGQISIEAEEAALSLTSGALSLRLQRTGSFAMQFIQGQSVVTEVAPDCLGYMEVKDRGNFIMQRLSLGIGECIYGLGERFGPLVKNGQTVSIWNEDGGTVSDLAYKSIPFYISSRGYGLLVNYPGRVDFEIGTERVSQLQFSVQSEELDYYLFYGPALKDVLEKYTRLSGRPAVPPAWSFGLWLSTSFTTHYNEKTVTEFVDGMSDRDIPLKVFHFDCFWMKERHWCDFEWDTNAFPDPQGMLKRLKAKGLKICLWINPYISQLSDLFDQGCEQGYFLMRPDGRVYQRDAWQPGMALVDFTNPAAVEWYCQKLQKLVDMGVDCFKTDFGELIPTDVVYHDGSDPQRMHNYYTYLYNKAVFGLLEKHHGKNNALVFARSATAGCQKFPVHWGGDCVSTFESMAEDLRGGLSFCLSGPAFWSHDIGGFSGTADPALYKRWVAFGLLSTHSRLHGSESYRVPWLFDEESVSVMRFFTKLKNTLLPYLLSAAYDAAEFGWPLLRAMVLEFPGDPACQYLDRQYMLGSSLLVAPVFRHDNIVEYYLPAGRWTHLLSGETISGGTWRRETVDFMTIPLFVRENTILATSADETQPQWRPEDPLTIRLFQITEQSAARTTVVASDGKSRLEFVCNKVGRKVTLTCQGRADRVSVWNRGGLIAWKNLSQPFTFEEPG
jgi:alpha-D-xyloside xylohydrolase